MRKLFVLCALTAAALLASPAGAQSSDFPQRYAACLAERRPALVRELLQATTAEAASKPYHSLADEESCFSRVMGNQQYRAEDVALSMDMLRGKLAEQELLGSAAQVAALPALTLQQKRYIRPWFAATGRNPAVDEMGACMADTDPAAILALVRTDPGSGDESAAISAMTPSLTKCLSAGTRLDAGRQALRAALADALYQRLNNPGFSEAKTPERGR